MRELRCIRPYLDFKTASTIATSIVHCKLDYCNSVYYRYNLPKSQTNRLQVIQKTLLPGLWLRLPNSVTSPLFSNLYILNECIGYKLLSLTYKALTTAQPTYLHSLISAQPLALLAPHLLSPFLDHLHLLL